MSTYIHPAAFNNSILSSSDMVQLTFGLCPFCGNPVHPLAPPSRHAQSCVPCNKVFFLEENLAGSEPIARARERAAPRLPLSGKASFLAQNPPPVEEAPPTRLAEAGGHERGARPEGATQPEHEMGQGPVPSRGPWADSAGAPAPAGVGPHGALDGGIPPCPSAKAPRAPASASPSPKPRLGHFRAQEEEYGSIRRSIQETLAFASESRHDNSWPYPPARPAASPSPSLPFASLRPHALPFLLGLTLGLAISAVALPFI